MCLHGSLENLKWGPTIQCLDLTLSLTESCRSSISICEAIDCTSADYYSTLRMSPCSYCQASAAGPAGIAWFCKMQLNLRALEMGRSSSPKPHPVQELPHNSRCTLRPGPLPPPESATSLVPHHPGCTFTRALTACYALGKAMLTLYPHPYLLQPPEGKGMAHP